MRKLTHGERMAVVLAQPCPYCGAAPGQPCVSKMGKQTTYHASRFAVLYGRWEDEDIVIPGEQEETGVDSRRERQVAMAKQLAQAGEDEQVANFTRAAAQRTMRLLDEEEDEEEAEEEVDVEVDNETYFLSALQWIRYFATMHWLGDAFDPIHMRQIANFASAAIRGEAISDYDQATARARVKAAEMMAWFDSEDSDG
jgi:hypothetical protein